MTSNLANTANTEHNPFRAPAAPLDDPGTRIDGEFRLNLFSPAGRIGRIRYLGYSMGLTFLISIVAGILAVVTTPAIAPLAYLPVIYVSVMLAIKRSHDFNTTGWLSVLVLVPLVNFLFLFVPGTDGPNRFGNKTAPNGRAGVFVIIVLIGLFLTGILAAIAIPAYQDYTKRARAAQGSQTSVAPAPASASGR